MEEVKREKFFGTNILLKGGFFFKLMGVEST
jgi:hypothetical protein